ncbi:MAG: ABC-type transport auxiliary lipoprotein family protein [Persicimonas sp.]
MSRWIPNILVIAVLVAAVSACGSTPETVHYRLDPNVEQDEQPPTQRPTLALEQLSVDAAYDDTQIAYRTSPYRLQRYYYHRWVAPPGLMVTDTLRSAYAKTGRFRSVITGSASRSDMILSGQIAAIEEVDISEEEWQGRIVLDLRLRDSTTGDLLWSVTVEERETLEERSPAGLAEALSEALERIVEHTSREFVEAYRGGDTDDES